MKDELLEIICCPICKGDFQFCAFERIEDEIVTGALVCSKCVQFYPISDGIPNILPEDLRDTDDDILFIKRWKKEFPKEIWELLKENLMKRFKNELPQAVPKVQKMKIFNLSS